MWLKCSQYLQLSNIVDNLNFMPATIGYEIKHPLLWMYSCASIVANICFSDMNSDYALGP